MSRLVDPRLCPDCRGRVGPDATCSACGLALTGPLATELWRTMLVADGLVERLRLAGHPVPAPAGPAAALSAYPAPPAVARPPRRLSGRAVPLVLLGIGGLFVLVAVSLFLAVTWAVLPLVVKAVLMLAVTAGFAAGAVALSRRGLRGATETFWTLVAGMLALDLSAGWRADLLGLGALGDRAVLVLGGLLLAATGLGAGLWVRRTPTGRCVAGELVLVLGTLAVAVAGLWSGPLSDGPGQAVGAVALAVAGAALLPRLREAACALLALGVASWALLAVVGLLDGSAVDTRGAYWAGLGSWQLLVAAGLAAAVTALPRPDPVVRTLAAGGALASVSAFALLPVSAGPLQWLLVAGVGVALAAVAATTPLVWARAAAALGAVVVTGTVLATLVVPVDRLADLGVRAPLWTGSPSLPVGTGAATWPVLVLLVASGAVVAGAMRLLGEWRAPARRVALATLPGLVGLGVVAALAGTAAPLWLLVGVLALTAAASVVTALRESGPARAAAALLAGEAALLGLLAASRSDLVTGVLATLLAVGSAVALGAAEQRAADRATAAPGAAVVLLASYAAYAWTLVGGAGTGVRAVVLAGVACLFLLGAAYAVRHNASRLALELSPLAPGLAAVAVAAGDDELTAVVLTLLGSSLALLSVLHRDRTSVGWAASALLALATLSRVAGPTAAPEVYALPAAALLLGAGLWRLRREPEHPTRPLLGAGLSLALCPSLLLALPDPTSTRALLVGLGGLVALGLGARRHWQAPFLAGSAVLVVLAVRFLGPLAGQVLADPLGAWVLFGLAGAALLATGVLWESALGRLRTASRHLTALR